MIWTWSDKLCDVAIVIVGAVGLSTKGQLIRGANQGCVTAQSGPHTVSSFLLFVSVLSKESFEDDTTLRFDQQVLNLLLA